MGYICSICTDSLEKSPNDILPEEQQQRQQLRSASSSKSSSQLCAAPCGHIFHRVCLEKWMSSGAPGPSGILSSCPNCRIRIRRGTCVDVFPDSYDDSSPVSPSHEYKPKSGQHEKDIAELSNKLYNVEADFKIQLNLYNLLATDHQKQDLKFREEIRKKDMEIVTLKTEGDNARHNLEAEVQKLKLELESANRKLELEKGQRLGESTMTNGFFQTIVSKLADVQQTVQLYSLNFQRDPAPAKTSPNHQSEESKPGPSRLCKPYKGLGRPGVTFSKPRRGKKMFYERGTENEEIEEVDLEEESDDDETDFDIMSGPDNSRKRKLICVRSQSKNSDIPKLKIKRTLSNELSLSPICLTLSSDEDEQTAAGPVNITSATALVAMDSNEASMDTTENGSTAEADVGTSEGDTTEGGL